MTDTIESRKILADPEFLRVAQKMSDEAQYVEYDDCPEMAEIPWHLIEELRAAIARATGD